MRISTSALLVVCLVAAVCADKPKPKPEPKPEKPKSDKRDKDDDSYGPTLEDVHLLIKSVEDAKDEMFAGMGSAATLLGVVDQRLDNVHNDFLVALELSNQQQDEFVESCGDQVKAMEHRHDDAKALATGARLKADETDRINGRQAATLADNVAVIDGAQQEAMDELKEDVDSAKELWISNLENNLLGLGQTLIGLDQIISNIGSGVDSRKCEYATGSYAAGVHNIVFTADFDGVVPEVVIGMTGFMALVNQENTYDEAEILHPEAFADSVTVDGFSLEVNEHIPTGTVKLVSVSWMACVSL